MREEIDGLYETNGRGSPVLDVRFRGLLFKRFQAHVEKKYSFAHTQMYSNFVEKKTNRLRTALYRRPVFRTVGQSLEKISTFNKIESKRS